MPAFMQDTLLFPYQAGAQFAMGRQLRAAGPRWTRLHAQMPESTEQMLHPEKYAAGEAPVVVTLPAALATRMGPGWTLPMLDTLGELQTGHLAAREAAVDADVAGRCRRAGWGGDRMAVIEGPVGSLGAWAWHTVWDTPATRRVRECRVHGTGSRPARARPGAPGTREERAAGPGLASDAAAGRAPAPATGR